MMPERIREPNPELAKPRVAHGAGPLPTHISYIFHDSTGAYRLAIHQRGTLRSRLGFYRELTCPDTATYDALMDALIAARIPFMVGHMTPGPSDDAYFWLKDKGRRVDYLQIACGGKTAWEVREILDDAKEWRGVKLAELLPDAELDPFALAIAQTKSPLSAIVADPPAAPPVAPASPAPATAQVAVGQPQTPPAVSSQLSEVKPPPEPEPELESAPQPAAQPDAAQESARPQDSTTMAARSGSALPYRRWVEYGSALGLVFLLSLSFWRATAYFGHTIPFSSLSILWAAALVGTVIALAYTTVWVILFPRHFQRWRQRLELLILGLLAGALIALCEVMIANIQYDDAERIELSTRVITKTVFKGKYGRDPPEYWTYHLVVEPWDGSTKEQNLSVSQSAWHRLEPGQRIAFRPHPGRLGWIWYTKAELEAPDFVNALTP
jgi:hypothetical protein